MNPAELEFFQREGLAFTRVIAHGGYGVVYEVFSPQFKTKFALKKVPENRFNEEELDCLTTIDIPNIVRLYKYYKFDGFIYLLMEFCPNDLEHLFKHKENISDEEMYHYVYNVCANIKSCHERNIAHCDIKPGNFLIDMYGRVKIADFGLSSHEGSSCSVQKGTKMLMAPEIYFSCKYNPFKADIWALGVTLYFMATREYPFVSNNLQILQQKIACASFSCKKIENKLLVHVIERCLDRNPDSRANIFDIFNMPYFHQNTNDDSNGPITLASMHARPMIVKPRVNLGSSLTNFDPVNRSSISLIPGRKHFRRVGSQYDNIAA